MVQRKLEDRTFKLGSGTTSEYGRYVESLGEPRDGATALTGTDPASEVCRQRATEANWTKLLLVRCNALLDGQLAQDESSAWKEWLIEEVGWLSAAAGSDVSDFVPGVRLPEERAWCGALVGGPPEPQLDELRIRAEEVREVAFLEAISVSGKGTLTDQVDPAQPTRGELFG